MKDRYSAEYAARALKRREDRQIIAAISLSGALCAEGRQWARENHMSFSALMRGLLHRHLLTVSPFTRRRQTVKDATVR